MTRQRTGSIPGRVRLKDVATAAGVSMSTASRALSGEGASLRAIEAVQEAIRRLDYRPNPIARAMRAQTTGLIGMVVPSVSNPFFAELVEAMEQALHDARLELLLADSAGSPADEERRLQILTDRKVDGLLIVPTDHEASAAALRRAGPVPVVQLDRQVDGFPGDYVGVDNALGMQMVLDHLHDEGYRHLVFVSEAIASSTGRSRLEAFEALVRRMPDLRADAPMIGRFSVEFGRRAARTLIDQQRLPDAIVCGSDIIALGVVRELHRAGIAIPGDVGVTGFDGILFADLCDPPLTTVRQPVDTIAEEAVRLLSSRIGGSTSSPRRSEVAPTLSIRASSTRS